MYVSVYIYMYVSVYIYLLNELNKSLIQFILFIPPLVTAPDKTKATKSHESPSHIMRLPFSKCSSSHAERKSSRS